MIEKLFATLLGLVTLANSLSAPSSHAVHEKRDTTPTRWRRGDRVPSFAKLHVRVGLVQSNLENAHEYLLDISDPASPNYGKHWTSDEVIDMFKPSNDTIDEVHSWLLESGISRDAITHSRNQAWFAFDASAKQMETLLHTEYWEYQDEETGGVLPACESYHVPKVVQQHIDYITPGVKLLAPLDAPNEHQTRGLAKRQWSHQEPPHHQGPPHWRPGHRPHHPPPSCPLPDNPHTNLSTCDQIITPACIAALYEIPRSDLAHPDNSMGIYEAALQYWDQRDLNLFFTNYTDFIPNGTHPINNLVNGGVAQITTNLGRAGSEAMLDLDMAYPIVYPQKITVWNVDDLHYQAWANNSYTWGYNTLLDAIDGSYCSYCAFGECGNLQGVDPTYPDPARKGYDGHLQCGVFKPTNVISISYGGQEALVPLAYQKRQCNEYLKLGLQGVSFFFASGDAGVGNFAPERCLGPHNKIFNPTWPNNCPWITNVGATKIYPGKTVFEPESAAYFPATPEEPYYYASGGGFSNVYPIPDYQKNAVSTFFRDHEPPYPYYSGLVADSSDVYATPDVLSIAGSSGGIYNRAGRGIPDVAAVGDNAATVLNGSFYYNYGTSMSAPIFAGIINRINDERLAAGKSTLGFINPALYAHPEMLNDITNGTNPGCGTKGFSAVKGWDAVTGLGTPNYPKMLKYFMSLP